MTVKQDEYIRNVTEVELEHGINAGIRLNIYGLNLIPVFEEHQVRVLNRYTMDEWDELPYLDRVMFVALRRIDMAQKNVQAEAEIEDAERKSKVRGRK